MGKAKWIGGALGWAFGGPIGGILGFAFGSILDDKTFDKKPQKGNRKSNYRQEYKQYRHHTQNGDFASALLVLSAAVMKADGKLMKSELNYIRSFFSKNFGDSTASEQMGILKELLKKDIPVDKICAQISHFMEHSMRLQMLHYLFGIAGADGYVAASEEKLISEIARRLRISDRDYSSIRAMFYQDTNHSYTILEIDKEATDSEVKKAYRRMALKYHPDKISNLGESYQKAAKEKFQKVQDAYESIKKERGMP